MSRSIPKYVLTNRDLNLFGALFENRVMLLNQIQNQIFSGCSRQRVSKRLTELMECSFLERRRVDGEHGSVLSAFLNTPNAIQAIGNSYRYSISSQICKSDSVNHDIALVNLRSRLEKLKTVTGYFTENMLQACRIFSQRQDTEPFVLKNSDAAIEFTRGEQKLIVGLEFENSEKAHERYIRKLASYYNDGRTPVILYVCGSPRVQTAVAAAEYEVMGKKSPRCHYSFLENVLRPSESCTFTDLKGASIVLS